MLFLQRLLLFVLAIYSTYNYANESNNNVIPDSEVKAWAQYLKGQYVGPNAIKSAITGVTYPYHIYLPQNYDSQSHNSFPILYVLDGQWNFRGFAYTIDRDNRDVIIVAIEEGPKDSHQRDIDYRLPGVKNYINFFTQEFMPLVESSLQIDPTNRTLHGTSFGGLGVTYMMLMDEVDKPLFKNFVADDTSYWDRIAETDTLIQQRLATKNSINANLYLTSAFPLGNHFAVRGFIGRIEKLAIPNLNIDYRWYLSSHNNIVSNSMQDTLDLLYGEIE